MPTEPLDLEAIKARAETGIYTYQIVTYDIPALVAESPACCRMFR